MKILKVIWYVLFGKHTSAMCDQCKRGWYCDNGHLLEQFERE